MALASCYGQTASPLPQVRQNGAVKHLYVDNKPYLMLTGELHNSSASSVEYMNPIWDKLAAMHLRKGSPRLTARPCALRSVLAAASSATDGSGGMTREAYAV